MNESAEAQQLSIADQLLKQLQDEYLAVHAQNMFMPKLNIEPENDPENPYMSLDQDFNDQEQRSDGSKQFQITEQIDQQKEYQLASEQEEIEKFKQKIQNLQIKTEVSNPEDKQLIEVSPVDQSIYTDLPRKDFEIDEQKIKSFAISFEIHEPQWLQDQNLCKLRIQELFMKKINSKSFTKI